MSSSTAFRLLALFVLFLSIASASAKTKTHHSSTKPHPHSSTKSNPHSSTKSTPKPKVSSGPKNNSAKCPDFKKGSCSKSACNLPSSSYPFKFRSADLKMNELGTAAGSSHVACCNKCAATAGCSYWQFTPNLAKPCFLIKAGIAKHCDSSTITSGTSADSKGRQIMIGGICNPNAQVVDDPHFLGAQGTRFDFSGLPDKSFCLLTDKALHVNILLRGYLDNRTQSATIMHEGKAVRTWIREMGVVWTAEGVEHKLRMVARSGVEQKRANGFLEILEMDGVSQIVPQVGRTLSGAGGFSLSFVAMEKSGPYDVDFFSLKISDLLHLSIRMRVANPLLQSPTDAEAHFNIGVEDIKRTDAIHGVLGQTFRADHVDKSEKYSRLAALLKAPVVADGVTGKGFLDGEVVKDYTSSSILATDCAFSAYGESGDISVAAIASQ